MPDFGDKAAAYQSLTNTKAKEIDYFETLIFLNIEENTPVHSQDESSQFPLIFREWAWTLVKRFS